MVLRVLRQSIWQAAPAPARPDGTKLTKLTVVCSRNRFEVLKAGMPRIGVTGMTATQVMGCGVWKGKPNSIVEFP